MDEPTARLGWPLAIAASGGAAIAASVTRWWMHGPYNGVVAMVIAAAVGGWFGAMLSFSLRADPPSVTLRKAITTAVVAGPLTALISTLAGDHDELGAGTIALGVVIALLMLPFVVMAVHLARAAARSRERSLVGRSDRRAAWRATAQWLALVAALGTLPSLVDGSGRGLLADTFWWSRAEKAELAAAPVLVALAACAIAALVALGDAIAERRVARARRTSGAWRVEHAPAVTAALDVGLGLEAWMEHVGGRVTYREQAVERVAVRGDLSAGEDALRDATRRSAAVLAVAGAAEVVALATLSRVL